MKRATVLQIQQCRLKMISEGRVPSPSAVARELGAAFSPASIVLGLRQLESREVRRMHAPQQTRGLTLVGAMTTNQNLKSRLSTAEKLVAELSARNASLERRERSLNQDYIRTERKLAKSRYRNRDYKQAMVKLSSEIVALELALKRAGERWRPEHLSVPDLARAAFLDDNKTRLIALRYSRPKQQPQNFNESQQSGPMNFSQDGLCSRLLTALSLHEEHKYMMYHAIHAYADENKHFASVIKNLERKILVMEQNERRCNGAFSHLWPEEMLKNP